ncbi:MAG: type II toxin-antitoxin system RelE/ParE family toxin [Paracoccaceae bacterium]
MLRRSVIKHKGLRRFAFGDDRSGINPQWAERVEEILAALDAAVDPMELDLPHFRLHRLKGYRAGSYSLKVTKNYRITFRWEAGQPVDVDLEDYHGS